MSETTIKRKLGARQRAVLAIDSNGHYFYSTELDKFPSDAETHTVSFWEDIK